MKYEKLSKNIIEAVGGSNNIVTLQHCMTRLRFTLKDESKANDQKIEAIDGVLSLIKKGGQYQVVIGTHVHDVYLDVCQIANIKEDENFGNKKKKEFLILFFLQLLAASVQLFLFQQEQGWGNVFYYLYQ